MYLEMKALFSLIAMVFIGIVISQIILTNILLGFLLIVSIGMIFMGDLIIGHQITRNHLKPLIDPVPAGKELCILFTIGGMVDFVVTRKKPLGKREFIYYNYENRAMSEASVINDGSYPIRTINGNTGFVAHESYDMNVDLFQAKALEKCKGDDIKEIYNNIKEKKGLLKPIKKIKFRRGGNRNAR